MTADESSLQALSKILSEFYSGSVDAERRLAIHNILTNYEETPRAWYSALYYIYATSEKCVALYSLGVIERTVPSVWYSMREEEKAELLRVLRFYLFEQFSRADSSFLAKKTAQVLTLLACLDGVPLCVSLLEDVRSHLLSSLQNRNFAKISVALNSLRIIVEQIMDPCEEIGSKRANELQRWITTESVIINGILSSALLFLLGEDTVNRVKTLFYRCDSPENPSDLTEIRCLMLHFHRMLTKEVSDHSVGACSALIAWLECLIEILRRLPLDANFLDSFCDALFLFSLVGSPAFVSTCHASGSLSIDSHEADNLLSSVSLLSLTCIQELVDRKNLAPDMMQKSLLKIFPILQCHLILTTSDVLKAGSDGDQQQLKCYDKNLSEAVTADAQCHTSTVDYQLKLLDILKIVMTNFFYQVFSSPDLANVVRVHPLRFLALLHRFTFATLDLDIYISTLGLWNTFLEFLTMHYGSGEEGSVPGIRANILTSGLRDPLFALGKSLFARMLYSEASQFLETLDQEVSEDGWEYTVNYSSDVLGTSDMMALFRPDSLPNNSNCESSEYRLFLRETLTTLSAVLNLVPEPLVSLIIERYQVAWNDYMSFLQSSDFLSSVGLPFQFRSQPLHRIHWVLKDFTAIVQTIGFIMESINSASSVSNSAVTFSTQDILQSLVYCLHLNSQLVTASIALKHSPIRSDMIAVIVENLLALQSIVLGDYLTVTDSTAILSPEKIFLNVEQKNSFLMQVMQAIATFLLPTNGIPSTVPIPIQLCSARLFSTICSSPLFNDLTANKSLEVSKTTVQGIFSYMLDFLCDEKRRSLLPFDVLRILLRSFVRCLCAHPPEMTGVNGDLLERLISHCFTPHLTETVLQQDPSTYMLTLGLLNDAVEIVDSLSSLSRRRLQSILVSCGMLEGLIQCASSNLTRETQVSISAPHAYTAFLTFFTTYIRVLSQTSSTTATIPELLGRIIRALCMNAVDSQCGSPIPACLADRILGMFLALTKNRRLLVLLTGDMLDLCVHRILPVLGLRNCAETLISDEILPELVWAAGLHSPDSMKVFCELLFAMLSDGFGYFFESRTSANQSTILGDIGAPKSDLFVHVSRRYIIVKPDAFNRVMIILTAVFHERQVSSALVSSTLNGFFTLHRLRKFFDLQPFNQLWLPELMHKLLSLLINRQHDCCKDIILATLHSLTLCGVLPNAGIDIDTPNTTSKCSEYFVHYFLPAFFSTLSYVSGVEQSTVFAHFYQSFQSITAGSPVTRELIDLSDSDTFSRLTSQLVVDLRAFRASSTRKVTPSSSVPEGM
ncbi:hypothetical protein FBUS_02060 [Fasciolopsis buskii]|uniref:Uncharacterized protein n=1 Tax=Fasciolopsis buskii TaxID=27845 RepID=A0A8E0RTT9_9TREM|nr:hypothetical protein FBUS_02060 [Fasciolopsis buski]